MRAPRSYTRQDVVEFHVGAWPAVVPDLVAGLVAAGARLAEPGEFTFRALLNGRLDLAQAEAVMAVIAAGSETALRAAGQLLGGRLSAEVERLAGRVRAILAQVEADLDFADQDVEPAALARVAADLGDLRRDLADTARRCRAIETYCGEVRLVLAGWPNAGKSSLFNRLLEAERAIVSPAPGTTRDELRARLHAGGLELVLSDTAGLDEARDELAGKVRAKALEAIGRADLVLLCLDATAGAYERTDDLAALVTAPVVVAVTKCDAAPPAAALAYAAARLPGAPAVATSARTGQGLDDLRAALVRAVEGGDVDRASAGPVITARHRAAMETAAVALARAARVARRGAGELAALEMREALEALGRILGRDAGADILGEIFARFCIGK
jgi:tRNA modification GTPase